MIADPLHHLSRATTSIAVVRSSISVKLRKFLDRRLRGIGKLGRISLSTLTIRKPNLSMQARCVHARHLLVEPGTKRMVNQYESSLHSSISMKLVSREP